MPSSDVHPKEIIEFTTEYHLARLSRKSQAIYIIIILTLIAFCILLPFLFIDISVKSTGLLKAASEVSLLRATSSGYITEVFIKENGTVTKGQLLLDIRSPLLEEKEHYLKIKLEEVNLFIRDVKDLSAENYKTPNYVPKTALYRQSLSNYYQKLTDRQNRFLKVEQDYNRNKKLYDQRVIAEAEFETYRFEFEKAKGDLELVRQEQLSEWQQELRNYEKERADYQNQLVQVLKEQEILNIKSPVNGSIQNLAGIYPGSPVFPNQELAQISPDTNLIAEVYVSPNDIGLLHEGMEVRMQIGAFNYNQWGLLHGMIHEISGDIQIINNQPIFKVKCSLDQDYLKLANGYQGKLKKGMTLEARFLVTQRSLWQLIYDKMDNWVNPNLSENHRPLTRDK
ncbi:MAG: HlyD family efflux transporter periplasmic adaptor subunit [Cyclobacteriaceae bacterium]